MRLQTATFSRTAWSVYTATLYFVLPQGSEMLHQSSNQCSFGDVCPSHIVLCKARRLLLAGPCMGPWIHANVNVHMDTAGTLKVCVDTCIYVDYV
jgi:hypothetical protein